jgi:ubiquinone/menaquinone biosynthesis C-methylase UbiE
VNKWSQKRKIMRRYDLTARMYDERYADEQAAKYQVALKCLDIDGSVLDVGCGTGLFFSHIVPHAQTVVATDISRSLLLQSKKRAKASLNVHLIRADADRLPFIDSCFDVVFAFTLLQNMPKPLETLSELKRNAKRGAHVVVSGLKKIFSLDAFTMLLEDAGLQVISFEDGEALRCNVAVTVRR